ncbi:MAG: glycoside hydrolase family 3 C-terminal domain-containing protein [Clostridia bacterium]|nr:glycoside hydrolase family 3 C-terminal domain-containing protein [Clostridia bacterium]
MLFYQDKTHSAEARARDLLSRMTLEEKLLQMNNHMHVEPLYEQLQQEGKVEARGSLFTAYLYEEEHLNALQDYFVNHTRLGIPILVAFEGQRGLQNKNGTIFPQTAGVGGSFNRENVQEMAEIIGEESKIVGIRQIYAPDLDIPRDPRWGRMQECYGEDPYLVGEMGKEYVTGLQKHSVASTLKHFICYGVPEGGINIAPNHLGQREMREVMLEPFRKCVQAGAMSVMPAYNELDGEPLHASKRLLQGVLREELGFDGVTVTDYSAVRMLHTRHCVAPDALAAGKLALDAGLDLEAPVPFGYGEEMLQAVKEGIVDEKKIDEAVFRILLLKFRLGLFENPYALNERIKETHSSRAVALSRKMDRESILLLENDGILPLSEEKAGTVAVIGNNGKDSFLGDYTVNTPSCVSFYDGMVNRLGTDRVLYARGCNPVTGSEEMLREAVETAAKADTVFLVLGDCANTGGGVCGELDEHLKEFTCGEGYDTHDLRLYPWQQRLFDAVIKLGKPTVLVLYAGRPHAIKKEADQVNAFLFSWGGGEQSGNAFADLIFGDVSPSAKLSISFPQSTGHIPCYYNHKVSARGNYKKPGTPEKPGRDYVTASPAPWYPFGYGLSYTKVKYSDLKAEKKGSVLSVSVTVENIGDYDIDESILLFTRAIYAPITPFVKELKAFEKVPLKKGEKKIVSFMLTEEDLTYVDHAYQRVPLHTTYRIMVEDLACEIDF